MISQYVLGVKQLGERISSIGIVGWNRLLSDDFHGLDNHVRLWNVVMVALSPGIHFFDGIDDFHSFDDFAKNGIPPTVSRRGGKIEEPVVYRIDKKLGARGVWGIGTGHGEGSPEIFELYGTFVTDIPLRVFFGHSRLETPALDHELWDYPVENYPVVESFPNVGEKIRAGQRGFFLFELDRERSEVGGGEYLGHGNFGKGVFMVVDCRENRFFCEPILHVRYHEVSALIPFHAPLEYRDSDTAEYRGSK